jgi:hypothetical protein
MGRSGPVRRLFHPGPPDMAPNQLPLGLASNDQRLTPISRTRQYRLNSLYEPAVEQPALQPDRRSLCPVLDQVFLDNLRFEQKDLGIVGMDDRPHPVHIGKPEGFDAGEVLKHALAGATK